MQSKLNYSINIDLNQNLMCVEKDYQTKRITTKKYQLTNFSFKKSYKQIPNEIHHWKKQQGNKKLTT